MLVFSYAVELDAADPKADGYETLLREAVQAYRARAGCHRARADIVAESRDLKRAAALDAKLANGGSAGRVTVRNDWELPVTLVIAGATHTLSPGETRSLPAPPGSSSFEMQAGPHRITGTVEAGKSYRINPPVVP